MLTTVVSMLVLSAGLGPMADSTRNHLPKPSLEALAARVKAHAQPADPDDDSPLRRVYDLRDLAATLPEHTGIGQIADTVFVMLAESNYLPLDEGVYMVDAPMSAHRIAGEALETLRSLHAGGYRVRLELIMSDIGTSIRVGDPRPQGDGSITFAIHEQFVRRRSPASIEASTRTDYVAEWSPIVSDNAVGYDPEIRSMDDGLSGSLLVGAGPEVAGRVQVRFTGVLSHGSLESVVVNAPGAGVIADLPISTARLTTRGMDLRASVPLGRSTVIGVLQGFGPDAQIAIVIEVSSAE